MLLSEPGSKKGTDMRQLSERVKCAFLPDRRSALVGLNAVAVVAAALVLTGASGARSSSASARPVSGAPAQKQAVAAGIDIGAVSATVERDIAPDTTSNPDILAPADLIVGEADGQVALTVTLSDQGDSQVSVHYTTADSTATQGTVCGNGADYLIASGTLIFEPGETTKTVPVQIVDCPNVEPFEAFTFNLSSEINGHIARASSRISIVDNDTIVSTPKLFVRDAVVDEKDGNALVSVLLGGPAGQASNSTVTVHYATADGTASEDSDYSSRSDTLTFASGETAKTIAVPITDEGTAEGPENFTFNLSTAEQRRHRHRHGDGHDRRERHARFDRPGHSGGRRSGHR